jgi:uncharacterized membrane protein YeiB
MSHTPLTGPPVRAGLRPSATSGTRIHALDALRGLALCGILFVNIPWILATTMEQGPPSGGAYPAVRLLEITVHGRFFPIFSFLFGVGFALFLDSAATRARRPRMVLLRRLLVLGVLGIAHHQLQPGEALLPYAVVGILVLLPASWLPRPVVGAGAALGLGAGVAVGGGTLLIPGMFLLGLAAVRYGVIDTLYAHRRGIAVLFVVAATAAIPAAFWQEASRSGRYAEQVAAFAGLLGAAAYATGLLLVLPTRAGTRIQTILAPLGRMALTNYLGATLIVTAAEPVVHLHGSHHYGRMAALAAVLLAGQAVASHWWLSRYRYGPLEWGWRCLTWWTWMPNRHTSGPADIRRPVRGRARRGHVGDGIIAFPTKTIGLIGDLGHRLLTVGNGRR